MSYAAGRLPADAQHRLAAAAEGSLRSALQNSPEAAAAGRMRVAAVREPRERAFGDGGGIILVAHTTTGCILGGCGHESRHIVCGGT